MLGNKRAKILTLITLDYILINLAYFISIYFRFKYQEVPLGEIVSIFSQDIIRITVIAAIYIIIFTIYRQYKSIWTIASIEEFSSGVLAVGTSVIIVVALSVIDKDRISIIVSLMAGVMIMLFCNGIRIGWRIIRRTVLYMESEKGDNYRKVLLVGAGGAGAIVVSEYKRNLKFRKKVVSIVDDNKEKLGTYIAGVKVVGNRYDIPSIVKEKDIDEIIIAISEIKEEALKGIIDICKETKAQIKIMPGVSEIIDGTFNLNKIRDVDVEDLLGREPVQLDLNGISSYLENKVILVTGGGGSIGSELCRQIVKFNPKELIILDIYENNAYDLQNELLRNNDNLKLKTLIGSVRDRNRLKSIYSKYKPEVVFHAAAHKHVPLMEDSPMEAIKNNVEGTLNVAELASEYGVERFVLISTDKAVNPTNVMGASKRICETIIQAIDKESKTEFVAVRFGNVLGSNGSVVPLFKKQIESGGPVTLTHKNITRYFMTIPEASQLVLQAGAIAKGGEIFVLDMGKPIRIYDLAENLIRLSGYEPNVDIEIAITGLRPGEKLYEELLMDEEGLIATKHSKIFIGKPGDFKLALVKQQINELMDVIRFGNSDMLRKKIVEVVPSYKVLKADLEEVITKN